MTDTHGKTLTEIENDEWGPPNFDSHLVTTIHRLRHKPLGDFTVEDLRIYLGQGLGPEHLMPFALYELERDPIAEGDFYPGDLLYAVLTLSSSYFAAHSEHAHRLRSIYERARKELAENEYPTTKFDLAAAKHWRP